MKSQQDPLVSFFRVLPGLAPRRARTDAAGTLPINAYRYCEPVRAASALGYYVFLPMTFEIVWDGGTEAVWSFDQGDNWYPLSEVAFPNSFALWDQIAPKQCQGFCPSFLTMGENHAMVQIWTGWLVRTAPNFSLLVRGPANMSKSTGYDVFEGIVEADSWFGPLFVNIRLTRTEAPILFDSMRPFLQVQLLERASYSEEVLNRVSVFDASQMAQELWSDYHSSLIKPNIEKHPKGHYAVSVRKRRDAHE